MGKNYCKVEKKWCKFLKRGVCQKTDCKISDVSRCPRLAEMETVRFYNLLNEVEFEDVFERLCFWFRDQESSKEGYEEVFYLLLNKTPRKHNLNDLFINISKVFEDGQEWLDVDGKDMLHKNGTRYAIEFVPWDDWISMFITQETLDTLSKEEIVAGCLYEMTFYGFTEKKVENKHNELISALEEFKK